MGDLGLFADRVLDRVAARRRRAHSTSGWSFAAEAASLRVLSGEATGVGVSGSGLASLDAFEARMTDLIEATLARHLDGPAGAVGVALSQATFGDKSYVNRLDRQLAVGASAVALTLAEESGVAVVAEALRQAFLRGGDARPALPPGSYVVGRGGATAGKASGSADSVGAAPDAGRSGRPVPGPGVAASGHAAVRCPPRSGRVRTGRDGLRAAVLGPAAAADAGAPTGTRP